MKICAIIVTYGDRYSLLEQVLNSIIRQVDKIIVVNNGSSPSSSEKLEAYAQIHPNILQIIHLKENLGSAGGYKKGLETAFKDDDCEYIWLLDDDNKPLNNALKVLKDFWTTRLPDKRNESIALLSYRHDREIYKKAVLSESPNLVLGNQNSFMTFHIKNLFKKTYRTIRSFFQKPLQNVEHGFKSGKVAVAPYGGMFFHKNLLNSIGYPKEEYYVYADDHDWSYQITKKGGEIHLVLDSIIEDIDTSWYQSKKNEPLYKIIPTQNPFRIYYTVRNRVYFEKKYLVGNYFIYQLNRIVFQSVLLLFSLKNLSTYKVFCNAVKDGLNQDMGENDNIRL